MRWPGCSEATQGDSRTMETAGAVGFIWNRLCLVKAAKSSGLGGPRGPCLTLGKPSHDRARPHTHLIYQDQGILRLGLLQALDDLPRHGAHVCPPGGRHSGAVGVSAARGSHSTPQAQLPGSSRTAVRATCLPELPGRGSGDMYNVAQWRPDNC